MILKNLMLSSAILFSNASGLSYNAGFMFDNDVQITNLEEKYLNNFNACYFEYDETNNSISLKNDLCYRIEGDNTFAIDELLSIYDSSSVSGGFYGELSYLSEANTSNFKITFTFKEIEFTHVPSTLSTRNFTMYFADAPLSHSISSGVNSNILKNLDFKEWLISFNGSVVSSIFDTIRDVVGGYSDTITNTFDGLMGIFYDSETNTLKPISTLLLIPVGIGIVLFAYYTIKRLL